MSRVRWTAAVAPAALLAAGCSGDEPAATRDPGVLHACVVPTPLSFEQAPDGSGAADALERWFLD